MTTVTAVAALLAEEEGKRAVPAPILLGLVAFGSLLLALFLVTRFNKDR